MMSAKEFAGELADLTKLMIDKKIAKSEQPLLDLIQSLEDRIAALEARLDGGADD